MSNKSSRHKETNTFKFQSFSERISNLEINVYHKVGHGNEAINEEESKCLFYQTIEKWAVLNLSESFTKFMKEVNARHIITLPQLFHNKDKVVDILIKYLSSKDVMCLQPILGLTAALAEDLRKDFYPYFSRFLVVLIDLLHLKDADQVEGVFTCLAYIFKFLWIPLSKNISAVFSSLLPLLSDGKPQYIINFAAESFSFVARKVRDLQTFLDVIVKSIQKNTDGIVGCGKLLFEAIHGNGELFHSCAESWLPFLFDNLANTKYEQDLYFKILEQVVANILQNISSQNADPFWISCFTVLSKFCNSFPNDNEEVNYAKENLLKLIGQAIEYRRGSFVKNPGGIINHILKILNNPYLSNSLLKVTIQLCIVVLLAKNVRLSQEQASQLIGRVLLCTKSDNYLYFIEHLIDYSGFDLYILPSFLNTCIYTEKLKQESLNVLTKVLLKKSSFCDTGVAFNLWRRFPISSSSLRDNEIILRNMCKNLNIENFDLETYASTTICISHLNVVLSEIEEKLGNNCKILLENILKSEKSNCEEQKQNLLLLLCTVECMAHHNILHLLDYKKLMDVLLPLCNNKKLVESLNIIDLYLTAVKPDEKIFCTEMLLQLHKYLEENFNSPYHNVRLLTTHIYMLFEDLPYFLEKCNVFKDCWKIFSICYMVESTEFQVQTFKEQVLRLEKLSYEKSQISQLCTSTVFKLIPLRYLCGLLYINFQLIWEPVSKLIATYAKGMEINDFWTVFGTELKRAHLTANSAGEEQFLESLEKFRLFLPNIYPSESKPDFFNYRLLLWNAMTSFSEIAEAKTRDVSEIFLTFMREEYNYSHSEFIKTCDIKTHTDRSIEGENTPNNENYNAPDDLNHKIERKYSLKNKERLLSSILNVYAKVRSPMSIYQEPQLKRIYLDLLSHKNNQIQKLALDCLMTYQHEYLIVYKEYLYDLIDNKKFKNQIRLFRIGTDSSDVQEKHRKDLIPILIRIVLSKMTSKIGLRTGGKGSGQLRRNLVLRFLSGCLEDEVQIFVETAFRSYSKYLQTTQFNLTECDLEKFIPPKKLQSSVNLLLLVFEELAGSLGNNSLKYLLKVLLFIGTHLKAAFSQISDVHVAYREILKKLRSSCIRVLERFFNHFKKYPWSPEEIEIMFEVFIWLYLPKLEMEGIHSPTSLLRLFLQWASNPPYFDLLIKHHPNDKNLTVMPFVMKLLTNKASNVVVCKAIMEMVNNLLKLEDEDEFEENEKISVNYVLTLKNNHIPNNVFEKLKLNKGSYIILPFIQTILKKIRIKLKNSKKRLTAVELSVLSRISELVWDSQLSAAVLLLIIPIFSKQCHSNEDTVLKFTKTLSNLFITIDCPEKYLSKLIPLFGEISCKSARIQLCQLQTKIAEKTKNNQLKTLANIVTGLNAWNERFITEPDFEKRIEIFKEINVLVESNQIELELGLAIFFNCCYTLKFENDLSLKEKASYCWKKVSVALLNNYINNRQQILDENIFPIICKGFRNDNNEFRNECILLLGFIARECPASHTVLNQLNALTNKTDLEVDFFENITHLQIHRHVRALLRFVEIFKEKYDDNNTRTLTQFIFPLVSFYLHNEKYASKNSLIDSAIEAVKILCKILPWNSYRILLKFYLNKLKRPTIFQRQMVRVTVGILDAFHYDLSNGCTEKTNNVDKKEEAKTNELMKEETKNDSTLEEDGTETKEEELDLEPDFNVSENVDNKQEIVMENGIVVLSKSAATKVISSIQTVFLPQLNKLLVEYSALNSSHKLNKKKTLGEKEEEDLQKVPISLALVKLLQKLPKSVLDNHLPRILLKLATFLKSHLESVRRVTRETFEQIMCAVGPKYLTNFLEIIRPLLSKGFLSHVLVYTVHGVLTSLKDLYEPGDMDIIIGTALNICTADLFGTIAEEKEVEKLRIKTPESKTTRSYETFQILALFITEKYLMNLVLPLKTLLLTSRSLKNIQKLQECFRHIALGLVANKFIAPESLLKFAYGMASQSITEMFILESNEKVSKEKQQRLLTQQTDCFLIQPAIKEEKGARMKASKPSDMNNYILVTFGLNICLNLIKTDKVRDDFYRGYLDPFVKLFKDSLSSQHVKLNMIALKCLMRITRYDLPSLKGSIKDITEQIFKILHKYAVAGLNKGDNFDLVLIAFKFMSALLRDVNYYSIEANQLKMLLFYIEQDIHENGRQINGLMLLKAIIRRKLILPEIHAVMNKVAKLTITSSIAEIREYSRQVFMNYFTEYPLGKKLDSYVTFYLSQISYEYQLGRESALEMIYSFINSFPMGTLKRKSASIMISLGTQLVNDDDPQCKKKIANCLINMFSRLTKPNRDPLFDIIMKWFQDEKVNHRRLAAQLCGFLINSEKSTFESRLAALMPTLVSQFNIRDSSSTVSLNKTNPLSVDSNQWIKDHYIFQLLQVVLKLCTHCPTFLNQTEEIEILASYAQSLLSYSHQWVRLAAAQFLGFVLSNIDTDQLLDLMINNKSLECGYLYSNPRIGTKSLALDLSAQLQTNSENEELTDQIIKNLVFIARILQKVKVPPEEENNVPNLSWLAKRLKRISNWELVHSPNTSSARKAIFKWIAAVGTILGDDQILTILEILLSILVREMDNIDKNDSSLRHLAKEVGGILQKRVKEEKYSNQVFKVRQNLSIRQNERKRINKQLAVSNTELHAKKKIKRNAKKKEKKRYNDKKTGTIRKGQKRKISSSENV